MRKYARPGLVMLHPVTGEAFSATPGDYFQLREDEVVQLDTPDMDGTVPGVLAVRIPEHYQLLAKRAEREAGES